MVLGAEGSIGFPNLNDDDWLWGGKIDDIYSTILYGIRSDHENTKSSQMPAFGKDEILTKSEINLVADYVLSLSKDSNYKNKKGKKIFIENCAVCHGPQGKGGREFGAPNLSDAIWLYGNSKSVIIDVIYNSRNGVMPNWNERLDLNTIKQLSIYVHHLGGGE